MEKYYDDEILVLVDDIPSGYNAHAKCKMLILTKSVEEIRANAFNNSNIEKVVIFNENIRISTSSFMNTPLRKNNFNSLFLYINDDENECKNYIKKNEYGTTNIRNDDPYHPYRRVSEMKISNRSYHCLQNSEYASLRLIDLYEIDEYQFLKIRNLGRKSVKEITDYIKTSKEKYGYIGHKKEGIDDINNDFEHLNKKIVNFVGVSFPNLSSNNSSDLTIINEVHPDIEKSDELVRLIDDHIDENMQLSRLELTNEAINLLNQIGFYNKTIKELRMIEESKFDKIRTINYNAYNELIKYYKVG